MSGFTELDGPPPTEEDLAACGGVEDLDMQPQPLYTGLPDVLTEAGDLIRGDRQQHYGPPEINLNRIASLWSAYLETVVTAHDVCALMILLKQARGRAGYNRDNAVDTAGYAGLQEMVS